MANWSNPQLTSTYTNFLAEVKDRDVDLALQFDGTTSTNIPTNAIRWDSSANRWKKWSGSVWGELTATYALTALSLTGSITFEGATDDAYETTLTVVDPTADRTITLPNVTGTVVTTGDSGSVTSTMIADGTIVNGDVNASAAIAGTKISPDFGSQTVTTTGVFSAALGTAGAPSITFTGDVNTGLYSPGADQVAISTGGTGRVFVNANGDVLLGSFSSIDSNFPLQLNAAASQLRGVGVNNAGGYGVYLVYDNTTRYGGAAAAVRNIANSPLVFETNNSEKLRVTATGDVNIKGAGTAGSTQAVSFSGSAPVNSLVVQATTGNVGIGTNSPTGIFEACGSSSYFRPAGASGTFFQITAGAANGDVTLTASANSGGYPPLVFSVGGSEKMRLDASGNLGLGVTPSAWNTVFKVLQIGQGAFGGQTNAQTVFAVSNAYYDSTGYKYIANTYATRYVQFNGAHEWYNAPSGTAGNTTTITSGQSYTTVASGNQTAFGAPNNTVGTTWTATSSGTLSSGTVIQNITFTQAMTLDASGNLGIGETNPTAKLYVTGLSTQGYFNFKAGAASAGYGAFMNSAGTIIGYLGNGGGGALTGGASTDFVVRAENNLLFTKGNSEAARINNQGYLTGTVNGLSSGIYPSKQYFRLNSNLTGSNVNTAQSVFGVGATLIGSTQYEFECLMILLAGNITTSTSVSFGFGGTATLNNILYSGTGPGLISKVVGGSYKSGAGSFWYSSASSSIIVDSTGVLPIDVAYIIKGTVSVNAGGTFIPQYKFGAAPGNAWVTAAGSYFNIWPLGASGSNTSIGSWA